ncbi:MAG: aryl-sulfate sulfotransferase [Deltaproteobacteria bacterium]|nr:aryl-sulfate sulfotransferase [Deltaproteobacteria bacterium]
MEMKKMIFCVLTSVFILFMSAGSAFAVHIIYAPTGVMHWDKDLAYNGYNMVGGNVLDMAGNLLFTTETLGAGVITREGTQVGLRMGKGKGRNRAPGSVVERDGGKTIWQWVSPSNDTHYLHHDFERIWNKKLKRNTVLVVSMHNISEEEAVAAGSDPDNQGSGSADAIIEIDMSIPQDPDNPTNNIIWKWRFWDHVVQYYKKDGKSASGRSTYGNPIRPEDDYGRLDLNVDTNNGSGFKNDWNHVNGIDYHAERDEILISCRETSEQFVIDHSLTEEEAAGPKGDIVYRWGNPYNYTKAEEDKATLRGNGHQQTFGQHHTQWIDEGFPGEGEWLTFENGSFRPQFTAHSAIYQINPYDKNGNYIRENDAGYTDSRGSYGIMSNQITWAWSASEFDKFNNGFYSSHGSKATRLPNGNTLITASEGGHVLEVTMDKKVAWEYISPVTRTRGEWLERLIPGVENRASVTRYPLDHPGLSKRVKEAIQSGEITPVAGDADVGGNY